MREKENGHMLTTLFMYNAWTERPSLSGRFTRLDPPSLPLPRLHAPHPILPHARIPVPSLLPRILLLPHRTPPLPRPRPQHLPESVRRGTSVPGGNLVMLSGLVGIFHLAVRGFRGGIDRLVVLLSACQYKM